MTTLEFQPWPKIARLNREITVTEKIDGTNAAVVIVPLEDIEHTTHTRQDGVKVHTFDGPDAVCSVKNDETGQVYGVFTQSRTRFITPEQDNYGFAGWVQRNAEALVAILGAGTHFGEWWGSGIQRKYGLTGGDKRFSLFNTARWADPESQSVRDTRPAAFAAIPELHHVPVLYRGGFSEENILTELERLRNWGSMAAESFMRPEGIVVWHDAARQSFKVTLEGDAAPKGQEAHRFDEEKIAA